MNKPNPMKGHQYIVMRMVTPLFVLILGLTQLLSAQTTPGIGCIYLEGDKPSVYISYVRKQAVKNEKGKTEQKVFLRLHNNSTCEIWVGTPDNTRDPTLFKYETRTKSNGEKLTALWQSPPSKDFDLDIFYDIQESKNKSWKPANYWDGRDLVFKYTIPSGYSAAFPVDERFFRKRQPISVPFEYEWEDSDDLRTLGTISHRVKYAYDLPKGYFKEEDSQTYPASLFAPIKDPNKPDWEILPQEAKAGEVILSKRNELGILSNFVATGKDTSELGVRATPLLSCGHLH